MHYSVKLSSYPKSSHFTFAAPVVPQPRFTANNEVLRPVLCFENLMQSVFLLHAQ